MALANGLLVVASVRRFPYVVTATPVAVEADRSARTGLRRLNWPAFVLQLSGLIGVLSDSIVIALFMSPRVVMTFFLTQRLASIAQMQLQSIGTSSWAAMAEIYGQGELTAFNQRALELTRLVTIASLALLIPIAAFNRTFIGLWVGPELHGGLRVTIAAALVALGQSLLSTWGWFFHAAGLLPRLVPVSIATVVVNLVASIICVRVYGIVGPLLDTLLSYALVSSWAFPLLMRRAFGLPIRHLARALVWPVVVGAPIMAGTAWISTQPFFQTWLGWLTGGGLSASTYLLLVWLFLLNADDRLVWRNRLRDGLAYLRS